MIYDPLLVEQYGGLESYREQFYDNPPYLHKPKRTFVNGVIRHVVFQAALTPLIHNVFEPGNNRTAVYAFMGGHLLSVIGDHNRSHLVATQQSEEVVKTD